LTSNISEDAPKIFGNLAFLSESFRADPTQNITPLSLEDLEVFQTLEEITGYIYIDSWPEELANLSVFESLHVIRGRLLHNGAYSLVVRNLSISSLGLRSLKEISSGLVLLEANPNLCYLDSIPWTKIFRSPRQAILKTTNKPQ
ncbi:unnamed protein product, partial [Staurois parvus]